MEEPLSKKQKMLPPNVADDGDDDLERLEAMPTSSQSAPRQSPMNGMVSTPSSSFSQQEPGGPPSSSSSFPSSSNQQQQPPPPPPQQPSVLQELLLSNASGSNTTMNSPRGSFPGHPPPNQQQGQPPNFPTRSPMGAVSGASTMMSPPQVAQMGGRPPQMGGGGPPQMGGQGQQPSQMGGPQQMQQAQQQQRGPMPPGYPADMSAQQQFQHQQMMAQQGGMYAMQQGARGVPPGYPMQPGQGRGQAAGGPQAAAAAAAAMGRGMMVANGASIQRGAHMQRGAQQGMMHPGMQQNPPGGMMNRAMMGPQFEQGQMMGQREFMNPQAAYNGMPQMAGRPQQGQPQYPGAGQQGMMPGQQMMMSDPAAIQQMQQAHLRQQQQQQQQQQQGMMANGMGRGVVPQAGHPSQMAGGVPPSAAAAAAQAQAAAAAAAAAAGPGGALGNAQDPEKRKLIQQQLVLLLHAHKCQQRERHQDGSSRNMCSLPHCSTMKDVLQHMTTCNNGRQCNYAHCASSRQIIHHWKNCQREDCPVCRPLKNIQASTPGQGARMGDLGNMDLLMSSPHMGGMGAMGSMPGGPSNHHQPGPNVGASIGGNMQNLQQQPMQPLAPTPSGARAAAIGKMMEMGSPGPVMPLPGNARQHLLNDYNPNEMRSPNGGHRGNGIGGDRSIQNWPPPEQPSTSKVWHADVTNDLRHHLVGKLVKAIFPSPDPAAMHDQRIKDLIQYARKVEKDMFENADDREEYYHLLAEKIYKIQKELQEKKQKRLSETRGGGGSMFDISGVKSEIPWNGSENMDGGPGSSSMAGDGMGAGPSGMNGIIVKKEEPDDCSSVNGGGSMNGGGWNPAMVKEEPQSSSMVSTPSSSQPPPSTTPAATSAAAAATPKKEVKRELTPPPPPGSECVFELSELRKYLEPILHDMEKSDDAVPFKMAVDPIALNIPDYHEIIKKPMDLGTIAQNLRSGRYTNPWQFADDMWLMFDNAWLYNRKNSKVYKYGTKLSEYFVDLINPAMQKMGYCCGQKLSFTPLALFCYGQSMCTIGRDQQYYCHENSSTTYGVTVSERYTYCMKCYENMPEEGISMSENPQDKSNMVPKSIFKLLKNNLIELEPFENCKYCHRKWHKICALHDKKVYQEGFVCLSCRTEKSMPLAENKFLAKKLPHCKLSTHLEDRVNGYIKSRLKGGEDHEVIIRVLSVVEKEVEVKPMMKQKYCGDNFPAKFPYKTKAIFAFEMIDGVEVCFFGLHVQEYGSKCPPPNHRRVYIAYLDSVHYFQPRQLRTDVYHEILLGYLDYAKKLGYTMAHIWACPPSEGDDYIFHCHPTEQKIPKPKRLQDWYKKMLDKGVQENCVVEYKDIYKQARDDGIATLADMPYFEGDFWPNVFEDCIREGMSEEAARKKEENDDDAEEEDVFTAGGGGGDNGKKKGSKSKKNNLKKSSTKSKKKTGGITGNEITDKLFSQLEKHKEVFFTIRLVTQQSALSLKAEIEDPDALMSSELMDGRDSFLNKAREEHWEFSSLRRAKYSTLCLAHALHESESKGMEYTCNNCQSTNAHWHCSTCEDFDLCDQCKSQVQHEHPLEKVKALLDDGGGERGDGSSGGAANRYESIQRCIHSLVHACTCRDANCRRMSCHKMKRVVAHTKMCKKRINASCPVCKQLIALCCYHAKHCTKEGCQVPFCTNIRQKLMEQKRSLARRSDMMMRRRMEGLNAVANANAAPSSAGGAGGGGNGGSGGGSGGGGPSSSNSNTGPPSASSGSAHNMKGGGQGTGMNPSMPSTSMGGSASHPMDHRNSKFGGQAPMPQQSTFPPAMAAAAAAAAANQQQQQPQQGMPGHGSMGGGMMGGQQQPGQYPMGMGGGGHPGMGAAGGHMMGGKPGGGGMMRPGMSVDQSGMAYRGGYGMGGGMMGGMPGGPAPGQPHPMHMGMRTGVHPGHDPNAAAAQQRLMQQRQQQQQQQQGGPGGNPSLQQQQQWQAQQQFGMGGRPYSATPQMPIPHNAQYMSPHYARGVQAQFPNQMGQQGMMGQQQPPPMVTNKPGEDGSFR